MMDLDEGGITCSFVGHEWCDAGGGLEMCEVCQAERWATVEYSTHTTEINRLRHRNAELEMEVSNARYFSSPRWQR